MTQHKMAPKLLHSCIMYIYSLHVCAERKCDFYETEVILSRIAYVVEHYSVLLISYKTQRAD